VVNLIGRVLRLGQEGGRALLGFDEVGRGALLSLGEDLSAALLGLRGDATSLFVGRTQNRALWAPSALVSVASSNVGFSARRWASLT